MNLNDDSRYRILAARDARFDGLFFFGVITTGIYCRPVCAARTPRRDRCRFFGSAAAAERAGFRPCLRCRPEVAPGCWPSEAAHAVARAAVQIEAGVLNGDEGGLDGLAREFGLSSRHLRRVMRQELGVSPVELAQTHRLLLAKQLLSETRLPIIEVAFASGFASVRRFNALFRARYHLTPGQLRRSCASSLQDGLLRLRLSYRPPLAWSQMLMFLANRATAGVECVMGEHYLRTVAVGKHRGWLKLGPAPVANALAVEFPMSLTRVLAPILARLRHLFDLNARPDVIESHLRRDPVIGPAVRRSPGLRVPGAFGGLELAIRAILGQRISVRAATTLACRFAETFGEPVVTPFPELNRLAPSAECVANAETSALVRLGISRARAESIRILARTIADGGLILEPGSDPETVINRLKEIPGIGAWTAQYIAMRALRWPDAFPDGDLGLLKGLGETSSRQLHDMAQAWRPWRAYAAMHIWNGLTSHMKRNASND